MASSCFPGHALLVTILCGYLSMDKSSPEIVRLTKKITPIIPIILIIYLQLKLAFCLCRRLRRNAKEHIHKMKKRKEIGEMKCGRQSLLIEKNGLDLTRC